MLHLHVNVSCGVQGVFPAKWVFSGFFQKKNNWTVTFKRIVIQPFINRVKCYILVQEVCGCDSNSAFTTLPSVAGTPLFMFLAKKNEKKVQRKISLETYFRIAENAVVLCKNFDTEGKTCPLCSRSRSVTRNKRAIRLMISGTVWSHLAPTDLWRTFIRFLKVSPRISRVKTYFRTRPFFPDCWPWSRY